jgi:8-oxo-dGTP pyrophosphatase MutT (NUDIX family)
MRVLDLFEDDSKHQQALNRTGFWGRRGAGCIIMARDTGRFCIAHRSNSVEQPGTWGTWGGAIDEGEDPAQAARRELAEEAGYAGAMKLVPLYVFKHESGFTYYNFLAIVEREFRPKLDWETQGWDWVEYGAWPNPLHPGLKAVLSDPHSVEVMRRATPPHPQRGSHYPSIETHSLTQPPKTESAVFEKESDEQEIAATPKSIHSKLQIRNPKSSERGVLHYYTDDGAKYINNFLHKHYRQQKSKLNKGADVAKIDKILKQYKLKENVKVYSGIPESPGRIWEKYKADVTKPVRVHLPAYTSTTTDFNIAYVNFAKTDYTNYNDHKPRNVLKGNLELYSMGVVSQGVKKVYDGWHILHIIVPAGYPAMSLLNVSKFGSQEEEILLPRGLDIEIEPNPYIKTTPGRPIVIWFAKVVGHNPVVIK